MNNILSSDEIRACTSCQMCAAVCPVNAISIHLDSDGFYRPTVDNVKCVGCGFCRKVCYKYDREIKLTDEDFLAKTTLLAASAKDDAVVSDTTSGGIADLLAHKLIEEGYQCIGVVYDATHSSAYDCIASTSEQVLAFRGSKYIQSYTENAFKELVRTCREKRFAVFGTPCHIYAIDRFLKLKGLRENCLLIDLYCHGCPSLLIWQKYIYEVQTHISGQNITDVKFRSKARGWGSGNYVIEIVSDSGKYISSRSNKFYNLFFSDLLLNSSCQSCQLRSTLAYTDIRLGDFWGKRYVANTRGVSAVSLVSQAGSNLFDRILPDLNCTQESYGNFLPYQSWNKTYHFSEKLRSQLLDQIRDKSVPLKKSVQTIYRNQTLRQRLKRYAKQGINLLPDTVIRKIKRFYY